MYLISHAQMVYNNLGSRGPGHLDEPPVIRLDRVGRWHGQDLDVVVSLFGDAHYEPCGENGLDKGGEIVVNAPRYIFFTRTRRAFGGLLKWRRGPLIEPSFRCRLLRWPSNRKQTWRSPSPPTRFSRA